MSANQESYVFFELAGSVYGIPSQSVQHIEMFEHVTLVPNANPAILIKEKALFFQRFLQVTLKKFLIMLMVIKEELQECS